MASPEISQQAREQHIFDMVGIWPAEAPVPPSQVRVLVDGVQARDTAAMEGLIAYRLTWIYGSFAKREAIQARTDLDEQDIMQIGCLATLEAAHQVKFNSPTPLSQQIVNLQEREAERSVMKAKLVPSINRLSQQPVYDIFSIPFDERAIDPVTLLEDAPLHALVEADGNPQSSENSIFKSAAYQRGLLIRTLEQLTAEELTIIRGRFGYDSEWPKSLGELAGDFNASRVEIRQKEYRALKKMRQIIPVASAAIYRETTQDDLTNYGLPI
jgi:hypothetical protein